MSIIATSTNLANALCKLVAVDALPAILKHMVVGNLVTRDFEPQLAERGDVVRTLIGTPVLLAHDVECTFQIPDVTKVLAVPDLLPLYMTPAAIALAEHVDTQLLAERHRLLQCDELSPEGVVNTAEARVPSHPRYLLTNSAGFRGFRQLRGWNEYSTAGEAGVRALLDCTVGKIHDVFVFRSNLLPDKEHVAFARPTLTLVTRRLPQPRPTTVGSVIGEYAELGNFGIQVLMHYTPNTLAQQFTMRLLYGVSSSGPLTGAYIRTN